MAKTANGKRPAPLAKVTLSEEELAQVLSQPGGASVPASDPTEFNARYDLAAVNQRLAGRIGALTLQVESLTQALQESREREMEGKKIIDEMMTVLEEKDAQSKQA